MLSGSGSLLHRTQQNRGEPKELCTDLRDLKATALCATGRRSSRSGSAPVCCSSISCSTGRGSSPGRPLLQKRAGSRESLDVLRVEAVSERMANYLIGHHPTMPGVGKTAQALRATCPQRLFAYLHDDNAPVATQDDGRVPLRERIRAIRRDPVKYGVRLVA